ncbi:MAG: prolipoprotein diacylglyceryl transferase, partial [Gammaproteobacteria bacterium]|nr:prolipoprotein diacylglyceryl transferase [Gammaproteobacteria bacterium]
IGGMSFHGGLLGVVVALIWLSKKQQRPFLVLTDFMAPVVPIGLGAGRIGNFINGELWGRITDQPWGMVFPRAGLEPRHPSQIYEFVLEGLVLFIVLWIFSSKPRPKGSVSGLFALLYGIFRFTVEFFRQPDEPIGYFFGWLTEGQLLSVPLIIFGAWLLISAYQKKTIIREHS